MTNEQTLIKKCGSIKARVTTFIKFLTSTLEQNLDETQALSVENQEQLEQRISRITKALDEFEEIQAAIDALSEDTESNVAARESFEKGYYDSISLAKTLLRRGTQQIQKIQRSEILLQGGEQITQAEPSQIKTQIVNNPAASQLIAS